MASSTWAISKISQLLPLDEASLQQILEYSSTLSKDEAADHLKNLLGDDLKALDFISLFNSRREAPKEAPNASQTISASQTLEAPSRKQRKKKAPLNNLPPPRQPEDHGNTSGAYSKKNQEDYMSGSRRPQKDSPVNIPGLSNRSEATQLPIPAPGLIAKQPPSASSSPLSDLQNVRTSARTASPASKTKINLSGGQPMHGASSTIQDLDSAIRTLELQTNPSLSSDPSARRCDCLATRHPLLAAAPNCLNCGKIICVKEGIGPCTFCSQPLLSSAEITSMIRSLREERGREKMAFNNSASHRRADGLQTPQTSATPPRTSSPATLSDANATLDLARQHRDRLLNFQSENARRTHVIDEAADFETPTSGQSMWSSPVERAAQLKRQQKVLRDQEWNAKPEYEKRRVVVSVDLVGGKVVKKMADVPKPSETNESEPNLTLPHDAAPATHHGAFSNNPLMGALIRPVWKSQDSPGATVSVEGKENGRKSTWRRVQDDDEDNEAWILDGGVYGGRDAVLDGDERGLG